MNGGRPWQKGQSGNPGGRPKGQAVLQAAIARAIREKTKDGADLVEFVYLVWQGKAEGMTSESSRRWAADWLSDRGFGKPRETLDVTIEPSNAALDLSELTTEDLRRLAEGADGDAQPPAA